uniref:Importin N-terminal domain-containing protein n=1 Tax=Meloidogyne enterolobii TaxID=390850 RepID=A0A6V7WNP5_MELEN|nr:unnamed protein product [Meloidogyne enterolobii]
MDNISLDSVYEAVNALNGPDPSRNGAAIKWLEQFQKSIDAWTIADRILNEARSSDACLFAAQTLRNKLLYQMHELPSDSYVALRDSLLSLLSNIETRLGRNVSSITVQICAALSDLYIQVLEWRGFIPQLIALFGVQGNTQNKQIFLNFFRIFPEELYNRKLKIGENRRQEIELEMAAETVQVLNILSQLCSSHDASSPSSVTLTNCVNCLASWLLNKQCPTEILAHSPLLHSVIGCLTQNSVASDLHDAATECLVNAFQLINDGNIPPQQIELARILQQGVLHTGEAFRSAVRDEDGDKLINYTRLYAEHCEAFLTEIAKHPGDGFGDLRGLEMLQIVNEYHDYNLVEMSFNVWYRLSEYLYQCDEPDFDELRIAFKPFVEKHILSLCRHCRIDSDSQEMLSERSELAEFRYRAQESVRDVTFIIGSVDLLRLLMEHLNTSTSWDQMEAILFIISSFINNIVESEKLVVPTLLDAILKLPLSGTHKQLLKTSAQLLGNLQDWLIAQTISAPSQGDSDYMVRTFEWFCTLFGFADGCMALTVAESLEFLVERGCGEIQKRSLHERYLNILSGLILSVEKSQGKAQEMEKAAQHLLKASTYLINDLPSPQLCSFLELLSVKSIDNLERINSNSIPPDPQTSPISTTTSNKENISDAWQTLSTDPILWLDRLSSVWRILKPWEIQLEYKKGSQKQECPWLPLCTRVVQCTLVTLQQQQEKQRVIEHCCRTIRFLIRSMGQQSIVFIEPLANQIILVYGRFPHSCLLYLASILVDEYGNLEFVQPGMLSMLENLATRALLLLSSVPNGFEMNPDTVDDLYRLAVRFVQRSPSSVFSHQISAHLLQNAINGLNICQVDANRSLSKFIMEVIDVAAGKRKESSIQLADVQRVKQLLLSLCPQIMLSTVSAALFHLSTLLSKEMAEIMFGLIQLDKQKAEEWLNFTCSQIPHDGGNSATPEQLLDFRTRVLSAVRSYDVILALRDLRKFYA